MAAWKASYWRVRVRGERGRRGEEAKGEGEGERGLLTRVIGVDVADMACEVDEEVGR